MGSQGDVLVRGHARRTSAAAMIAAAVGVGAVLLGVTGLGPQGPGAGGGSPTTPVAGLDPEQVSPGPTGEATSIDLDLGAVTDPADVAACAGDDFASDPADVEVLYGQRQRTHDGSVAVLVLRNPAGDLRLCDMFGSDGPSQSPIPQATVDSPLALLGGRRVWDCEGPQGDPMFSMSEWISVAESVEEVRTRYVVDGAPGPWYTTRAHGGIVHVQTWLEGPLPPDGVILEQQVLDGSGAHVEQSELAARGPVDGCTDGSMQIA